mmetsp:Transcript_28339/g.51152  ORF Transcript_28339/g.51152 Transcript_28339/m.51152 type:complete len:85 (+) Transcript_28339:51-305(+)
MLSLCTRSGCRKTLAAAPGPCCVLSRGIMEGVLTDKKDNNMFQNESRRRKFMFGVFAVFSVVTVVAVQLNPPEQPQKAEAEARS